MRCIEGFSLFTAYRDALKEHGKNLTSLKDAVLTIPQCEFQILWRSAQFTQEKCMDAQRLLQLHALKHHCMDPSPKAFSPRTSS